MRLADLLRSKGRGEAAKVEPGRAPGGNEHGSASTSKSAIGETGTRGNPGTTRSASEQIGTTGSAASRSRREGSAGEQGAGARGEGGARTNTGSGGHVGTHSSMGSGAHAGARPGREEDVALGPGADGSAHAGANGERNTPGGESTAGDALAGASGGARSASGEEVQLLPLDQIRANPYQPRREFGAEQLEELASSIREHGLLHPVVVRACEGGYELVAGERRVRACRSLGWAAIPAIVREMSDAEVAEIALIENLQRENLGFFEEAEGYLRLLQDFGLTQEELAARLGKSQSTIANKLRLLRLSDEVRRWISQAMLTERHARALLRIEKEEDQLRAIKVIIARELNVRQAEEWIEREFGPSAQSRKRARKRLQAVRGIYTDYRLFTNSVRKLVEQMERDGVPVELEESHLQEFVEIRIRLRRQSKGGR